jgi:hypothetical protein
MACFLASAPLRKASSIFAVANLGKRQIDGAKWLLKSNKLFETSF